MSKSKVVIPYMKDFPASAREQKGTQGQHRFILYYSNPTDKRESFVFPPHPTNKKVFSRGGGSLT